MKLNVPTAIVIAGVSMGLGQFAEALFSSPHAPLITMMIVFGAVYIAMFKYS